MTTAQLRRSIHKEIQAAGYQLSGGGSSPAEMQSLTDTARKFDAKLIAEIGLNTGLSAHAFLNAGSDVYVISFDLGKHTYIKKVKEIIDTTYGYSRHALILGDSRLTIPAYAHDNQMVKFDLVFIDGGHAYNIAIADIMNMRRLSRPGTIVIVDDLCPWKDWGRGPTKAWEEAIDRGVIEPLELYQDGVLVDRAEPPGVRVWGVGRY